MSVLSLTAGQSPAALLFDNMTIKQGSITSLLSHISTDETIITDDLDYRQYKASHVVSQLEAWIYAALSGDKPDMAGFIVSVPSGCYIGYYNSNKIELLKHFEYPNSLELFMAAAMRFTGQSSLDSFLDKAIIGSPSYEPIINQYILAQEDHSSYRLLTDLTRGIGRGPENIDICASAQNIYEQVVASLAYWLAITLDTNNIIISGSIVNNAKLLSRLKLSYNIYLPPSAHPSIRALGGLVKYHNAVLFTLELCSESITNLYEPDNLAHNLLTVKNSINQHHGKKMFSDRQLGRDSNIFIPFVPIANQYKGLPLYVCQEQDYDACFTNNIDDKWAQYLHMPKLAGLRIGRVLITNLTRHYYLNRVLMVTRQAGYPVLQLADNK